MFRRKPLLTMKKCPRSLMVSLQSRDRHPWMETPPSLPQGEECLTEANLYGSLYPNECHKVGTDAPRLSAHLPLCVFPLGNISSLERLREAFYLLCFGGQTRASVPTLKPHPLSPLRMERGVNTPIYMYANTCQIQR